MELCHWIRDKQGRSIRFVPNHHQLLLNTRKKEADEAGKLRRFLLTKFRQFGGTTFEVGTSDYISGHERGMYCLTMAHDLDSTIKIFEIANRMYESATRPSLCYRSTGNPRYHWKRVTPNRRELKYEEADSLHFIGTAGNLNFGHGLTPQRAHLSEAARFPDLAQTLAALEGVPASGEIIQESTPHGAVGPYYELNQEAYNDPKFEWTLIFLVWYDFDYALPCSGDEAVQILQEVQRGAHARFGAEEQALAQRLAAEGHEPLTAGQWKFRRWKRGSLKDLFWEQYPEDFVSCWLASGRPFFDLLTIMQTPSRPVIRTEEAGLAWVYEDAIAGRDYVLWADPAEGIERGSEDDASADAVTAANKGVTDFTAWGIIDRDTNEDVAVFLGRVTVSELARMIDKWGRVYNEALAVPERNNHGHAVILALKEIYAYPNLYHHLDGLNDDGSEDRRPGWPTGPNNRTTMLDNFDMEVREGSYKMIDARMRAQALTFIVNSRGRAEAGKTYHDDLITGRAIGNEVVRQPMNYGLAMIG